MNHDSDYPQRSDEQWDSADQVDAASNGYNVEETEDTEAIKAQIEQTRAEMSHTIDAIQNKLNPDRIVEQVKDSVREATVGRAEQMVYEATDTAREMSSSFVDRLLDNPVPTAMVALGLGWLYMKGGSSRDRYRQDYYRAGSRRSYENDYDRNMRSRNVRYDNRGYAYDRQEGYGSRAYPYDRPEYGRDYRGARYADEGPGMVDRVSNLANEAQEGASDVLNQAQRTVGNVAGQAQQKVSNLAEGAQQTAGEIANQAQQTASQLADEARTKAYEAREYVGEWGDEAYYRAERASDRLEQFFYRNPMAIAGVALAIGAAVGGALPTTRREAELMGGMRDNLVHKAQDVVQETVQKVQTVAEEATETIKQEVKDKGLLDKAQQAAQEVTQVAKDVVSETKEAVKQEASAQGLTTAGTGSGSAGSTPGSSTGMGSSSANRPSTPTGATSTGMGGGSAGSTSASSTNRPGSTGSAGSTGSGSAGSTGGNTPSRSGGTTGSGGSGNSGSSGGNRS